METQGIFMSDMSRIRSRYLNLLETALVGTLYGDPGSQPWSSREFHPDKRALGRDWPALAQTMIGSIRMRSLRHMCETVLLDDIPGDFIETGVWRGGASIYMKGILEARQLGSRNPIYNWRWWGRPGPAHRWAVR